MEKFIRIHSHIVSKWLCVTFIGFDICGLMKSMVGRYLLSLSNIPIKLNHDLLRLISYHFTINSSRCCCRELIDKLYAELFLLSLPLYYNVKTKKCIAHKKRIKSLQIQVLYVQ